MKKKLLYSFFALISAALLCGAGVRDGHLQRLKTAKKLYGKIRVVTAGEDYKVRIVGAQEDVRVRIVASRPNKVGQWQYVEHGEDYKVCFVEYGGDVWVRFVDAQEGITFDR